MSRDTAMLTPIFENIPQELKKLNRWVVWKDDKIPYDPHCTNSKAATDRPNSWGTFEQAHLAFEEGGWLCMGFVLNGDGLGKPTEQRQYINEVGLVRNALTGNSRADYDLANPPVGRKRIARRVICMNSRLITAHVAFNQRKQACRELVLKYEAQLPN